MAQPRLKNQLARMDPAELVRVLDFELDLQPLQDFSIVPPVSATSLRVCERGLGSFKPGVCTAAAADFFCLAVVRARGGCG